MSIRLLFSAATFLLLAGQALASTPAPSLEDLHTLLLAQQEQIAAQDARIVAQEQRLNSLERELADQRMLVMAQQRQLFAQKERGLDQERVVAHLTEQAADARTELDLVQAMMATKQANAPALDKAGPTTASLEPVGMPEEDPLPYSLTAGLEYLIASSDSFRFYSIDEPNHDRDSVNWDGRALSPGFWVDLAYQAASGITWGAGFHYWAEVDTKYSASGDLYIDITQDPLWIDRVNATLNALRVYGDLYGRGLLSDSGTLRLDLLAGLRLGMFNQSIYAEDADFPSDWVSAEANYWGLGPRLGLAVDWSLWDALSVVADADVALLVGQSRSASDNDPSSGVYSETNRSLDSAWMFDSKIGLQYLRALEQSRLAFGMGLNLEYWTGLPDFPRADEPNIDARYRDTDVLLLGPYVDVQWDF